MLIDLQTFDVVVSQSDSNCGTDPEEADHYLRVQTSTESIAGDHKSTCVAKEEEKDQEVTVQAVEEEKFMPDFGNELPGNEEADGNDGG